MKYKIPFSCSLKHCFDTELIKQIVFDPIKYWAMIFSLFEMCRERGNFNKVIKIFYISRYERNKIEKKNSKTSFARSRVTINNLSAKIWTHLSIFLLFTIENFQFKFTYLPNCCHSIEFVPWKEKKRKIWLEIQ